MNLEFIFLYVFLFSFTFASEELQLVHVFFRHGARTPEEKDMYPNDPYTLESFMPMGYSQLTNEGIEQAYKLGCNLRSRYDFLLGDVYSRDMVKATSTDYDRTKMSALAVLSGLFPPSGIQIWNNNINWMPIPYYYEKGEHDFVLRRPTHYCPTYVREYQRVINSVHCKHVLNENEEILKVLSENSGKPITTLIDVFDLYQTITAEYYMNLTLPEWVKSVYPEPLSYLAGLQCNFENYNQILKRLNGGRSLSMVISNMKNKIAKTIVPDKRRMFLYAGHENNVINILAALNLFEPHVTNYSSSVLLELYYVPEKHEHAVKIIYARNVDAEPVTLKLEGCDELCPFEDFLRIAKPNVPGNYTAECESLIDLGEF